MMIIYGASGHGKVVCDILLANNPETDIVFIDDAPKGDIFYEYPLFLSHAYSVQNQPIIIAIGNNQIRENIAKRFQIFASAVHPSAVISNSAMVKEGTVIMANATCNADATIGRHVILNTACSVDHDCEIGDFCHISPNVALAGNVKIGHGSHIGIGATVIQGIKIGKFATIGAGAVIIEDVPDGVTVVGVPGKIIK